MEEVKKTGLTFIDTRRLANISYKDIKNGFVGFGYYLKIIHDEKLWQGNGYNGFNQFLDAEYGKDKSWASRCINLYDKFGIPVEPGELPRLEEQYEAYNVSQLIEMLPMEEELRERITPDMPVKAIREMKPKKEKKVATVATPEPEPEPEVLHFIAGDRTIDNAYGAAIAAVVRAYLDGGYSRPEKECEVTAFGLVYKALKRQDVTVFYTDTGRTAFDIQNARLEEEYQYWHGTKAEPEPAKPTRSEAEQDSCPPGITDCRRQEWGTGSAEQEAGKKECKACWASWKRQHKALGAGAVELDAADMQQNEVDAAKVQQQQTAETHQEPNEINMPSLEMCVLDFQQNHMCKQCLQAVDDRDAKVLKQELISNHGKRHNSGSTPYGFYQCDPERIYFQDDMCETFKSLTWNGYVKELLKLLGNNERAETEDVVQESGTAVSEPSPSETVIDGEFTEILELEEGASDPEEPMTELQIAQDELERAKNLLKAGMECRVDEKDIYIRRLKLKVCALASYVCDLEQIENPPPEPKQPELPLLKNNDQRAAFIDNFETWPLWIETKQTGERYYRYDLEDGTSMVVKVYHARIFDGYASGSYEAQYHDGYGRHEYYLLQQGKFFRDCETNRGLLIEKLKEIQKVKKG